MEQMRPSRERAVLATLALAALAIVLGTGSAVAALEIAADLGTTRIGAWTTSATLGSGRGSLYERAAVAVHALFRSRALPGYERPPCIGHPSGPPRCFNLVSIGRWTVGEISLPRKRAETFAPRG
jgi:hypothetical protein